MNKVLIIKNITREGPGLFENLLKKHQISYKIVDLHKGETFPDSKNYSALFVCGGPDSANDTTEKMTQELKGVKKAIELGIPYFGACLGMQVLVKSQGGRSIKSQTKEIGWRDPDDNLFEINLTKDGKTDLLFENLKSPLKIFHLHGETVELPSGFKILATGKFCPIQTVKFGENAYGFQGHCELTLEMFKVWISEDPDLLEKNKNELASDYEKIKLEYENIGKIVLTNFLKIAKLI